MSFYFTYVLLSEVDKKFYTGYTSNLMQRFDQHNNGQVTSTKHRRPLTLIYYEACLNQEDALKREKYLKTFYGKMFIHKRIKSYLTGCKAQGGSSRADFKNKVFISLKEMRESNYWMKALKGINENKEINKEIVELVNESQELKNILGSIASKLK